jgi:hypothetical protein
MLGCLLQEKDLNNSAKPKKNLSIGREVTGF